MNLLKLLILILSLRAPFAFATKPAWASRREAHVLHVAMPILPASLEATSLRFTNHFLLLQCTCQTLVRISDAGNIVGDAAVRWTFSNEGRKATFSINPEAKFSDGTPVTAQDFVRMFRHNLEAGPFSTVNSYLKRVAANSQFARALDNGTLELELARPYPPLLQMLSMPGLCVQKDSAGGPIGSGPLRVKQMSPGILTLEKNPYFVGRVPWREMQIRAVPELANSLTKISWPDVDVILGAAPNALEGLNRAEFKVLGFENLAMAHLYFNLERRPDLTFGERQRIRRLTREFAGTHQNMFLEPMDHVFPRGLLPDHYYERAVKLEPATLMPLKNSRPLEIKLLSNIFSPRFAEDLSALLDANHLPNRVTRIDPPEYLEALRVGNYDLIGGSFALNYGDADSALDPLDPESSLRLGRFDSAIYLKRLDQIRHQTDNALRLKQYADVLLDLERQAYVVPLYRLRMPVVHRAGLEIPPTSYRYETELWKMGWH